MTPESKKKLFAAAALVDDVIVSLDRTTTKCGHCQFEKYNNWEEFRQAKELKAITDKLRRFANAS